MELTLYQEHFHLGTQMTAQFENSAAAEIEEMKGMLVQQNLWFEHCYFAQTCQQGPTRSAQMHEWLAEVLQQIRGQLPVRFQLLVS